MLTMRVSVAERNPELYYPAQFGGTTQRPTHLKSETVSLRIPVPMGYGIHIFILYAVIFNLIVHIVPILTFALRFIRAKPFAIMKEYHVGREHVGG